MRYYVTDTAQANGDHEVHTSSCSFLPGETNRTYLGDFRTAPQRWLRRGACTRSATGATTAQERATRAKGFRESCR